MQVRDFFHHGGPGILVNLSVNTESKTVGCFRHNRDKIIPAEVLLGGCGKGIFFVIFTGPGKIMGD